MGNQQYKKFSDIFGIVSGYDIKSGLRVSNFFRNFPNFKDFQYFLKNSVLANFQRSLFLEFFKDL
jgi:hypothetical protein